MVQGNLKSQESSCNMLYILFLYNTVTYQNETPYIAVNFFYRLQKCCNVYLILEGNCVNCNILLRLHIALIITHYVSPYENKDNFINTNI